MKYKQLDQDPSKIVESVVVKPAILPDSGRQFQESSTEGGMRYLLPRIEAIHAGSTRNNTRYPGDKLRGSEELKSGVFSWTKPFPKPVIHNHDVETEATGRVQSAVYSEYTSAGRPGIIVTPKITSEKAIKDILEGRLLTVSIGATTDAAICSVCGTDIIGEGFCGHWKGETYEGVKAEWIVGNVWFDELSWVNVPADSDAMIIDSGQAISTAESFASNGREIINLGKKPSEWLVDQAQALEEGLSGHKKGELSMTEQEIKELQESLEAAKKSLKTAESDKEALTGQVQQLTTEKESLESDLATVTAAKETAEQAVETLTAEKATLTQEKETVVAEKATVEKALEEEKQAHVSALEENTRLASDIHKTIAERVVDLRISLGKEENRTEAITSYVARTKESLEDSLADLLKEASTSTPVTRKPELLKNPGLQTDPADPSKTPTEMTTEQALHRLFSGPSAGK